MIERLEFATPFVYSTRGRSPESLRSQQLRDRIKGADVSLYRQIAAHVAHLVSQGEFVGFFGPDVTLVPVPGHAPLAAGARLLATHIAESLLREGLASGIGELLRRDQRVNKSAFAEPLDRPRARTHFESLVVATPRACPRKILLVDDVITRGATMLGCASHLVESFPGVEVRAFGLLRPETDGEVAAIRQPRTGAIELDAMGESWRRP